MNIASFLFAAAPRHFFLMADKHFGPLTQGEPEVGDPPVDGRLY